MNNEEAVAVLVRELTAFRTQPYATLALRIGERGSLDYAVSGSSGAKYQIEVQFFWDDRPHGNIRVLASIDDGGWKALKPLNRGFIKRPDDSFAGE